MRRPVIECVPQYAPCAPAGQPDPKRKPDTTFTRFAGCSGEAQNRRRDDDRIVNPSLIERFRTNQSEQLVRGLHREQRD
jgi:hypothetical protein